MGGQPEALGFQRQCAAAGEGVVKAGQDFGVEQLGGLGVIAVEGAGFAPAFPNGGAGALQYAFVVGVFPFHEVADDVKQLFAADFGFFFVDAALQFALVAGVVHHLGENHGAGGGQRAARPPKVQRAGMPVADGFFAGGGGVDVV
nr:hypothetical protein [Neisseria bacilliformis]